MGALVVLIALGVSVAGSSSRCYGNASQPQTVSESGEQRLSATDALSDAFPNAFAERRVSLTHREAPPSPQCEPLPERPTFINSVRLRILRLLEETHLHDTSVQRNPSLASIRPQARRSPSARSAPPRGYSSASTPAQESTGSTRSVVLRL